jgi:hypothetical protein
LVKAVRTVLQMTTSSFELINSFALPIEGMAEAMDWSVDDIVVIDVVEDYDVMIEWVVSCLFF